MNVTGCRRDGPRNNSWPCHSKPSAAWQSMQHPSGALRAERLTLEGVFVHPSGQNSGSRQVQPIITSKSTEASSRTVRIIPLAAFAST